MSEPQTDYGSDAKPYLIGAFCVSILGAGLLLGADFGGDTHHHAYPFLFHILRRRRKKRGRFSGLPVT